MAGSVNKVILIGNLGADPEIRRTQDGRPIANLRIATSESWRDKATGERKEKTEWHRVVIFSEGLCKIVEQYLKKGSKVYIEGQLQTRKYNDKDGVEKYSTEVVLQNFNSTLPCSTPAAAAAAADRRFRRQLRLAGRDAGAQARDGRAPASAATWTTRFRSKRAAVARIAERRAHAVDHVLHGERREDHAEQPRQHHVAGDAEQLADPLGGEECDQARRHHDDDDREQHREPLRPVGGLAGQQDGRGDGAGPRHQRDRQREGGDVVDMLLDRLLGVLGVALAGASPSTISKATANSSKPAGDAERGQGDAELPQQPVADQRGADQDRAGDQAGAQRHLCGGTCADRPSVTARKAGTRPTGSTTTSSVTSAEIRNSSGMAAA